ncbi:hypothetical protein [uncultured Rothia sp.]|uniref:hypothetical protein n=1 Tax=uncultured Rothia sp. TaxID=316088 RepID=UPI003216F7DF
MKVEPNRFGFGIERVLDTLRLIHKVPIENGGGKRPSRLVRRANKTIHAASQTQPIPAGFFLPRTLGKPASHPSSQLATTVLYCRSTPYK